MSAEPLREEDPICHRHGGWHHHGGFEHSSGSQHDDADHTHVVNDTVLARHVEPHECPREGPWSACDFNRYVR